jgi:putative ABC transport system permease protein
MLTVLLAARSLRNRLLTTSLTVLSIGLSVALLVGIENLRYGMRESFAGTISGTDLIVGARGGSIQLLLSSVFGIGAPSAAVSWESYQRFAAHSAVGWTIPYSLGDSHRGYRVVGTTADFYEHYRYRDGSRIGLAAGRVPATDSEVAIGAAAARDLGYGLGETVELTHGLGPMSFVAHDQNPFQVVGILAETFTPVDRAVYVTLEGIAAMHEGWEEGAMPMPDFSGGALPGAPPPAVSATTGSVDTAGPAITSFLVGTRSRIDALQLQREVNTFEGEPLTAILPGIALAEMWRSVGYAEDALRIVSGFVVLVGLSGMIVSLYTSLNERRREMAVLRAVGARRGRIVTLLVLESGLLAVLGCLLGVSLVYGLLLAARGPVESNFGIHLPIRALGAAELSYLAAVIVAGFLLGLIPAAKAYRNALVDGLTLRV